MLFMSERQAESGECLPAMQAASVDDDGDVVFRLSWVFLFERAVDVTCDTVWAVVSHISQLSHTHTRTQPGYKTLGRFFEPLHLSTNIHKCCDELELSHDFSSNSDFVYHLLR